LKDLLLATEGPGLEDWGTRDFGPVNGFRDLEGALGSSGLVPPSSSSLLFPPMENRVIFLRVVLSMLPVLLSPGGDPAPFPSVFALEEAVCPL